MSKVVYCDICGGRIGILNECESHYITDAENEDLCKKCHNTIQAVIKLAKAMGQPVVDELRDWLKRFKKAKKD